jgi:hypothetical protein
LMHWDRSFERIVHRIESIIIFTLYPLLFFALRSSRDTGALSRPLNGWGSLSSSVVLRPWKCSVKSLQPSAPLHQTNMAFPSDRAIWSVHFVRSKLCHSEVPFHPIESIEHLIRKTSVPFHRGHRTIAMYNFHPSYWKYWRLTMWNFHSTLLAFPDVHDRWFLIGRFSPLN